MVDWICFLIEREQKFVREPKPNDVCPLRASADVSDSKLVAPYYWVARTLCRSLEMCSKSSLQHSKVTLGNKELFGRPKIVP